MYFRYFEARIQANTVNRGRFAGLNFCIFPGFQEYRKIFSVNVYLLCKLCIVALFKYFKHKAPRSFPMKNFIGWNPQKFNPANISSFTLYIIWAKYCFYNYVNAV